MTTFGRIKVTAEAEDQSPIAFRPRRIERTRRDRERHPNGYPWLDFTHVQLKGDGLSFNTATCY